MQKGKNILICPLEWGLGHAGRMIPLARKLHERGHNIFIGSGESHLRFFRKEIPGINLVLFPGFRIRYSGRIPQYLVVFFNTHRLIWHSIREHLAVKKIISDNKIDIIISDSRIGLWNKSITTVLVTHMLRIPHPRWLGFMEEAGFPVTRMVTGKFTYCYIPDLPGELNVSGKLSHNLVIPSNTRYIGILSRFSNKGNRFSGNGFNYYCTLILSGPEPQRTLLMRSIIPVLNASGKDAVILQGLPGDEITRRTEGSITYISHLPAEEMQELILSSEKIITRSGYTSLMELISLGKSALIIPTPGQPEQEYLASYMAERGWFRTQKQDKIGAGIILSREELIIAEAPEIASQSERLLNSSLDELLDDHH